MQYKRTLLLGKRHCLPFPYGDYRAKYQTKVPTPVTTLVCNLQIIPQALDDRVYNVCNPSAPIGREMAIVSFVLLRTQFWAFF